MASLMSKHDETMSNKLKGVLEFFARGVPQFPAEMPLCILVNLDCRNMTMYIPAVSWSIRNTRYMWTHANISKYIDLHQRIMELVSKCIKKRTAACEPDQTQKQSMPMTMLCFLYLFPRTRRHFYQRVWTQGRLFSPGRYLHSRPRV